MPGRIAKNTFYLTGASVAQKLFSFVYFTLIARIVGVEGTGLYVTALSFSSLFSILTDLGLTSVLVRESAKDRKKMPAWVNNTLALKIILLTFGYFILNLTIRLLSYPEALRYLVLWSGAVMVIDSLSLTFYGALRSQQNTRFEAYGVIAGQIITVAFGAAAIWAKLPLFYLIAALGLGSLFNAFFGYFNLKRLYQFKLKLSFDKRAIKAAAMLVVPFALAGIFTKVYSFIDVTIISYLLGARAVGLYSIASKITFAWQFIPMAFAAALYPAMSYYFAHNPARLKEVFIKGIKYLSLMAMPISIGLIVLADQLVTKIYGSVYESSTLPLQILLVSLIFAFLDFPVGALLNACHRQTIQTMAMGLTMVTNIILNLLLLPRLGIIGASLAALVGNFVLLTVGSFGVPSILGKLGTAFWWWQIKNLLAAGIMGTAVFSIKSPLFKIFMPFGFIPTAVYFVAIAGIGALLYLALLYLFGLLTKNDWQELLAMLKREPAPQEMPKSFNG